MHCKTEWSKLPLLLNWGPWKRESKSTWVNKMADLKELLFIQQEALYLYLSLSFFLCFLHPQNKQKEWILLTLLVYKKEGKKMRSWEEKNEWWGNMRESRPDQLVLLKGWPHFINKHSLFFFGERDQILLVLLFFRTLTSL